MKRSPPRSARSRQRAVAEARAKARRHQLHLQSRKFGLALRSLRDRGQALVRAPERALMAPERPVVHVMDRPAQVFAGLPPEATPVGAYMTRAEAMQALSAIQEQRGSGIATGLAIGLATVAVLGIGVVICYLLFRRKDEPSAALQGPVDMSPRLIEREIIREVPTYLPSRRRKRTPESHLKDSDPSSTLPTTTGQGTTTRSYSLPSIADPRSEAVRVATAGDVTTCVVVRAIAPIGSFAVLSFSAAELNIPGGDSIPVGDTLIIVVGDKQEIKLSPKQVIYGKGSTSGVIISVLSADA